MCGSPCNALNHLLFGVQDSESETDDEREGPRTPLSARTSKRKRHNVSKNRDDVVKRSKNGS